MKVLKILLPVILLGIIFFNIFSTLYNQREKYLTQNYWQNFPQLEKIYLDSQYVNKHPIWIPDEAAFSYAGGKLIQGTNPVLVVTDAPPLGKYLIGISAVIFNNDNIIIPIFGVISLVLLYLLSKQVLKNSLLALLPPTLLSCEPLFKNQLVYTPLLDYFQLVFLLSYFLLINKAVFSKKKTTVFFVLAGIFLGCFISTKFFMSGTTIIAAVGLWILLNKQYKQLWKFFLSVMTAVGILLLSYARVLAFGYSIRELFGIQKYVFLYHKSQIILPFSVWPLLLLNKWYVWFGDKPVISDSQWLFTWPLITIIAFVTMGFYLLKKIEWKKELEIPMLWTVCYLSFLSLGQTFSRYLLLVIPILYLICIYGIDRGVRFYWKKFHR